MRDRVQRAESAQHCAKLHSPRLLRLLSFHHNLQSRLWNNQIELVKSANWATLAWVARQIQGVVKDHLDLTASNINDASLHRTAGAFSKLGLRLGPYLLSGYDCQMSEGKYPKTLGQHSLGAASSAAQKLLRRRDRHEVCRRFPRLLSGGSIVLNGAAQSPREAAQRVC